MFSIVNCMKNELFSISIRRIIANILFVKLHFNEKFNNVVKSICKTKYCIQKVNDFFEMWSENPNDQIFMNLSRKIKKLFIFIFIDGFTIKSIIEKEQFNNTYRDALEYAENNTNEMNYLNIANLIKHMNEFNNLFYKYKEFDFDFNLNDNYIHVFV